MRRLVTEERITVIARIWIMSLLAGFSLCTGDEIGRSDPNGLNNQTHTAHLFQKVRLYMAIFQYKKEIGHFPDRNKKVLQELMGDNSLHKQFLENSNMLILDSHGQAVGEDGKRVIYNFVGDEISVVSAASL